MEGGEREREVSFCLEKTEIAKAYTRTLCTV